MFTTNKNQAIADQYAASVIEYEKFLYKKIQVKNEKNTNVLKSRGCPNQLMVERDHISE